MRPNSQPLFDNHSPQADINNPSHSFEKQLCIPGTRVGFTEVLNTVWQSIQEQNKLYLVVMVMGRLLLSVRRTMELFSDALWNRASDLHISFEGEKTKGSYFFLVKFSSEDDLVSVLNYSTWTIGGQLVILERYNPFKSDVEHKFDSYPIWLQVHGLLSFAAKSKEIIIALAEKSRIPGDKSIVVLQTLSKIKVTVNPFMQLTCESHIHTLLLGGR